MPRPSRTGRLSPIATRSLSVDVAQALRSLAAIRRAAGDRDGALEVDGLLVAVIRALDRPDPVPGGTILPVEGVRRHLAAAMLDLVAHEILAGAVDGDASRRRLDDVELMLDELKEASVLRVMHCGARSRQALGGRHR